MAFHARISAPSKLILGGSHFGIYGARIFAMATSLRGYADLHVFDNQLQLTNFIAHNKPVQMPDVAKKSVDAIIGLFRKKYGEDFAKHFLYLPLNAHEIPKGMGGSSVFAANLVMGLHALAGDDGKYSLALKKSSIVERNPLAQEFVEEVFAGEKACHGVISGIDPLTVIFGRAVSLKRNKDEMNFEELKLKMPSDSKLIVMHPAKYERKSTKELLQLFRNHYGDTPDEFHIKMANEIVEKLVKEFTSDIPNSNEIGFNFERYQQLMRPVTSDNDKRMIGFFNSLNAPAQISGAGHGTVVGLVQNSKVQEAMQRAQVHGFITFIAEPADFGVRVDEIKQIQF